MTNLESVKTTLGDSSDIKITAEGLKKKLQDSKDVRKFIWNSQDSLKSYLNENPQDKEEFTDLSSSILDNEKNKELLANIKDLTSEKDFGTDALKGLSESEKTERKNLQSLVMIASLYLWLTSGGTKEGTFQQVQDFAKGELNTISAPKPVTEIVLGDEEGEKVEEEEEVDSEANKLQEDIGGTTYYLKKQQTDPGEEKLYDTQGKEVGTYTGTNRYGAYTNDSYNEEKTEQIGADSYGINFIKHNNKRYKLTKTIEDPDGKYQEVGDVKQDKKNESNTTDIKETHDFLKNATVDKGTIYDGYDIEFDKTTGKVTVTKDGKQGVVTFTNFTGLGYGGNTFGKATVGGEELSVHIYKKVASPESKNYTIDINPQKIHLNETRIPLKNLIQTDYTLSSEKVTDKKKNVEVQDKSGIKVQLNSQSAYVYERTILGNSPGATVLPNDPSTPPPIDYQLYFPNNDIPRTTGVYVPDRTEKVINLGGKFYKNISGPRDTNNVYKEITATQTSAEEIQKQKEQEKKQQETEKSYDSLNTGLDTFGTELLGRGKLFENQVFRGHLESFADGLLDDVKKITKDVLGDDNKNDDFVSQIMTHFKDVFDFSGGNLTIKVDTLKDVTGQLNDKGKQLQKLVTGLFNAGQERIETLVADMGKDKETITGSDPTKEKQFDTMLKVMGDAKDKIALVNSYVKQEGLFLSVLDYVNKNEVSKNDTPNIDQVKVVATTEKVVRNTESMLDTYSLRNTFASGNVENMGPRMKKFLQETTPVTINGQTIYCNKKQLEKNGFVVEKDGNITKDNKPADQLLLDARKRGDIYGESVSQLVGTLYGNNNCTVLTKNNDDIRLKTDAEQKAWLEGLNKSNNNSPLLSAINKDKIVGENGLTDHIKNHNKNDSPADEDRLVTRIESDTYPVVTLTDKLVSTPLPVKEKLVADLYKVQVINNGTPEFIYIPRKALEKSLKPYADNLKSSASSDLAIKQQEEVKALSPDPLALFGQKFDIDTKNWRKDPENVNSILVGSGDGQFRIDMQDAQKPTLVLPVTYGKFNAKDRSSASEVSVSCSEKNVKEYVANAQLLMQQYGKIVAYRKLSENNKNEYPRNDPQKNTMKFLEEQASALLKGSVDRVTCEKYGFTPPSNKNTFSLTDFTRNDANKSLVMNKVSNDTQVSSVA